MSYVAAKALKVQKTRDDGTVFLDPRKPGDPVPEAAEWRDLDRWIRTGWIRPAAGTPPVVRGQRGAYKPPVPTTGVKVEAPTQTDESKPVDVVVAREQLEALTKKEVVSIARELKIQLDKDRSKGDFIDAILATEVSAKAA